MTNEQKAVKIATYDGWQYNEAKLSWGKIISDTYVDHIQKTVYGSLEDAYLTDLNYLVPVAVKVFKIVETHDADYLRDEILYLTKTPYNTYQPLFDAVFEAIVYLENQNA